MLVILIHTNFCAAWSPVQTFKSFRTKFCRTQILEAKDGSSSTSDVYKVTPLIVLHPSSVDAPWDSRPNKLSTPLSANSLFMPGRGIKLMPNDKKSSPGAANGVTLARAIFARVFHSKWLRCAPNGVVTCENETQMGSIDTKSTSATRIRTGMFPVFTKLFSAKMVTLKLCL
jgi:hypothetical protein